MEGNKRFLRPTEFADLLNISIDTLTDNLKNIPHLRIGPRTIRFDMESPELKEWMRSTVYA